MNAFSKAVEELNHLESISDAIRLMDEELSSKYHWNEEDETVVAFKTLVSRRFS
jgi:Mn-containing catalase